MKAFVLVNVRADKSPGVVTAPRRIDAVQIVHACWGRQGLFALVELRNERALSNLMIERVQAIDEIKFTDIHIVID